MKIYNLGLLQNKIDQSLTTYKRSLTIIKLVHNQEIEKYVLAYWSQEARGSTFLLDQHLRFV